MDYDATLFPAAELLAEPDPEPGAVEAMRRLKAAGFRIVIFTSRLSEHWLDAAGYRADDQLDLIEGQLRRHGIPYDEITADKLPCEAYIDDRAIRYDGDWPAITDWLLWSRTDCE